MFINIFKLISALTIGGRDTSSQAWVLVLTTLVCDCPISHPSPLLESEFPKGRDCNSFTLRPSASTRPDTDSMLCE